jgi:anthranilate synthase component 1
MQPPFDLPADLDTPVSAFLKLAAFEPRFLLESAAGHERAARFSFLGLGSALELVLDRRGLLLDGVRHPAPARADELLATLRAALARAPRLQPDVAQVPFRGGLVGCASYELARRFERLPARRSQAAEPELAYVAPRSLLVFDHLTRRVALLHAGDEAERRVLRTEILRALRGPLPVREKSGALGPARESLDREGFLVAFRAAREAIDAGEVYQLVLSSRMEGQARLDPLTVYRTLRLTNPSPYMYLLRFGERSIVGASPEALVRLSGREAALQPIAGTRARGADDEADRRLEAELLADPKEAAEHVMLVDLGRNDVGRVAIPGSVRVEPFRSVERYSHVMHLVSGVHGTLEPERDLFDLFAASFPAGTVVGAPKIRAMELIDELEPVGRGLYAGTVGYFGHGGAMDQAIAIRTIVLDGERYATQAGAGIVSDSSPERELEEIRLKSAAMLRALELAAEGL